MIASLQPYERLIHTATCGFRTPEGAIESVKLYRIVPEREIMKSGMTDGEQKVLDQIAANMAQREGIKGGAKRNANG